MSLTGNYRSRKHGDYILIHKSFQGTVDFVINFMILPEKKAARWGGLFFFDITYNLQSHEALENVKKSHLGEVLLSHHSF